jgi:hypothetical protein
MSGRRHDPEKLITVALRKVPSASLNELKRWVDPSEGAMRHPGPTETFGLGISLDDQREGDGIELQAVAVFVFYGWDVAQR